MIFVVTGLILACSSSIPQQVVGVAMMAYGAWRVGG